MKTRVVRVRVEPHEIYIGRGSMWGNPFRIGKDGTREEVISKYKAWILERPWMIPIIKVKLKGKVLGCHCKPEACHGDVLAAIADGELVPIRKGKT